MFLRYNKWALFWALLIFILCAIPGRDIPHISFLEILEFDKFIHAGLFFVLVMLLIRGFSLQTNFSSLRNFPIIFSFAICVVYGGVLELMQGAFFEERTADIYDFIANSFGNIMGMIFFRKINQMILVTFIK